MPQWKWCKVDRPGVWAHGGFGEKPDTEFMFEAWSADDMENEVWVHTLAWRAYLGPIPTIDPPEPELRLPAGWNSSIEKLATRAWCVVAQPDSEGWVGIEHLDKATAIRAAQAAVDELTKGTE